MTPPRGKPSEPDPKVHVVQHALVAHLLTEARDRRTRPARFRQVLAQLGGLIAYEATRDLAVRAVEVQTPLERGPGAQLAAPLTIVPILRAGLGLAEGITALFPDASVGHIGMFRDEAKLSPVRYYDKLPLAIAASVVLLVDPMLATGGSALAAIQLLRHRGCGQVRLICLVAAPEGVRKVAREFPDVPIHCAALDRQLDDRGYILPGLGDAGDRLFGTSEQ